MRKYKLLDGKKIVSRFRGKLVKIIRDAGSKFDDYSISPKCRKLNDDEREINRWKKL